MVLDEKPAGGDVTAILRRLQEGDEAVQDELVPRPIWSLLVT